jgi:hypothetical protein
VLEWIRDYYDKAELPTLKSIITNKAGGLTRAVEQVFPKVPHLLYISGILIITLKHTAVSFERPRSMLQKIIPPRKRDLPLSSLDNHV